MFRNCCYDRQNDVNNTFNAENMDVDMNIEMNANQIGGMQAPMAGGMQAPIIEPMQERVINRTIVHEVPHVCPMRTKIVNQSCIQTYLSTILFML